MSKMFHLDIEMPMDEARVLKKALPRLLIDKRSSDSLTYPIDEERFQRSLDRIYAALDCAEGT